MYQPIFNRGDSVKRVYLDSFLGLNRQDEIEDTEWCDMCNLSSDHMPYLSPRRSRDRVTGITQTGIRAICADNVDAGPLTSFTGVAGSRFYYRGADKGAVSASDDKCLVDFNGNILIFPDKKYYSYVDDKFGDIEAGYDNASLSFSNTGSEDDGDLLGVITKSGGWDLFKSGDAISIQTGNAQNNTYAVVSKYKQADDDQIVSCVVSRVDGNRLYVICYNRGNERLRFASGSATGSVKKAMPAIVMACVSNNRVFGIDAAGEMIYASKLGDFTNWYVYEGLSTDGWYAQVGTEGNFTGIATMNTAVVLFKRNYIHQVFGSAPNNFSIPKQLGTGCIDGRSITEVSGMLFFLAHDGFYLYNGGSPGKISTPLNTEYTAAISGSDGQKIYVCATRRDGEEEFLVYDLTRRVWHREDVPDQTVGFLAYNGYFYVATAGGVYDVKGAGTADSWMAVSKRFTDATMDRKGVINVYVRFRIAAGARLRLYRKSGHAPYNARFPDGFELCLDLTAEKEGVRRAPVRLVMGDSYQIKMEAEGNVIVEAIEKDLYVGGRREGGHYA